MGIQGMTQAHNQRIRAMSQPFSQRFEHTSMTSSLQRYAVTRMSNMSGIGSEASDLYGKYGH
jgi:endonuclease III-like uncharacterized protein